MSKYVCASDSLRSGQLDKLMKLVPTEKINLKAAVMSESVLEKDQVGLEDEVWKDL